MNDLNLEIFEGCLFLVEGVPVQGRPVPTLRCCPWQTLGSAATNTQGSLRPLEVRTKMKHKMKKAIVP